MRPTITPVTMAEREFALRRFLEQFDRMSEDEIVAHFRGYGFLDPGGHQLTSRIEFLALVRFAKRNNRNYIVLTA